MSLISVCSSAIAQPLAKKSDFRILPAGKFKTLDGRPALDKYWNLSEATGQKLVAEAANRTQDYLIDYEHQSLSGTKAPAAGWFNILTWKPDGLYVQMARWTQAAKSMIDSNEYRFISPVFTYDKDTLEVQSLVSIALTNTPALPALTDLGVAAALTQLKDSHIVSLTEKEQEYMQRVIGKNTLGTKVQSDDATLSKTNTSPELTGRSLEILNQVFPGEFTF